MIYTRLLGRQIKHHMALLQHEKRPTILANHKASFLSQTRGKDTRVMSFERICSNAVCVTLEFEILGFNKWLAACFGTRNMVGSR